MTQLGNVPEIKAVKQHLDEMKDRGLIQEWELPYEEILTNLTAAIFFLKPTEGGHLEKIWMELQAYKRLQYQANNACILSELPWRFEFNQELDMAS